MIVVLKENNKVYIAQPFLSLKHTEMADDDLINSNNLPLWKIDNTNIVGATDGNMLFNDLIKYSPDLFPETLTLNELILNVVPKIKQLAKENLLLNDEDELPCSFVLAQNDNAFIISQTGFVEMVENVSALGWYGDVIKGSIVKNKNSNTCKIKQCFKDARYSLGMEINKYVIINTKSLMPEVISTLTCS